MFQCLWAGKWKSYIILVAFVVLISCPASNIIGLFVMCLGIALWCVWEERNKSILAYANFRILWVMDKIMEITRS